MDARLRREVSEQDKRLCNLSRSRKISVVATLLLSLPFLVAALIWLPSLSDSRPWIGYSAGVLLFIEWMWRKGYPALKRRIAEAYREITIGGLRQVPGLCKRAYNDPGLFGLSLRVAIVLLLLYPLSIMLRIVLPFVFHPIFLLALTCVSSLAFIHWVWRRGYPALQQKLGPTGMRYMYGALVTATGGLAYVFARLYLNTLTGVDPGNFPKALTALTTFALVPASIFTIALIAALMSFGFMVAMVIAMGWSEIQRYSQQVRWLLGLPLSQARALPVGRIMVNMLGAFGIIAFCSLLVEGEVPPINHVVRAVAAYTLVVTEFSYDHTCPGSSKERLVARLKDFKEAKPPTVLIAEPL
jgi:hypothetical protein